MKNARPNKQGKREKQQRSGNPPLYAALDLGTNSCRMLIAQPLGGHFEVVDAFSKSVRLGLELERTGALSNAGINRTIQALHVCARKIKQRGVRQQRLVATEACRRATNGDAFMSRIRNETGLDLEIINPAEEARLAVVGCAPLVSHAARQVLVIDIGGGSTELIWIDIANVGAMDRVQAMMRLRPGGAGKDGVDNIEGAKVVDWISVPLGVATLLERYSDVEDDSARFALMSWYFEENIAEFGPYLDDSADLLDGLQMIGTSGTVTTIGAVHLGLTRYDRNKVDGMEMGAKDVDRVISHLLALGPAGRIAFPGIGQDRAALIMSGSAILQTILRIWPTDQIKVADRGLREGMLYSMMSADGAFGVLGK